MGVDADYRPDEAEYIPGDREHKLTGGARITLINPAVTNKFWSGMNARDRVCVIRWLQRGDAAGLLTQLSQPSSANVLRALALEGLSGGDLSGWRIRIGGRPTGGAPSQAAKELFAALRGALLTVDDLRIAMLAKRAAMIAKGTRTKRGRIANPMNVAVIGLTVEAQRVAGKSYGEATFDIARNLECRPPGKGRNGQPHNIKNVQRLYHQFMRFDGGK